MPWHDPTRLNTLNVGPRHGVAKKHIKKCNPSLIAFFLSFILLFNRLLKTSVI